MSKITVASYLMGIPPRNTNSEKPAIIVNFIEGVWRAGDDGTVVTDYEHVNTDVAVVQGFVHPGSKVSPHLNLRKLVFEKQAAAGNRSIIVDSNLFLYADANNTNQFLRYSYDGVFPSTGEYCNNTPDPNRWEIISNRLGIKLKPDKKSGNYILICCQRDGGWSMDSKPMMHWLANTIATIRKYTDMAIMVRFHPGDNSVISHKRALLRHKLHNVVLSTNIHLLQDFREAHAVVNYNSSPAVAAAIEGIPIFVLDPSRSQASEVANTDMSTIETPKLFDREQWIHKMAQMHWSLPELKDGTAWKHLRNWAKK